MLKPSVLGEMVVNEKVLFLERRRGSLNKYVYLFLLNTQYFISSLKHEFSIENIFSYFVLKQLIVGTH